MSKWISDCREAPFQECCETLVFGSFSLSPQCIDSKERGIDREHLINQPGAILLNPGHIANPLGQTLARFKYCVKVVILQKLCSAVL